MLNWIKEILNLSSRVLPIQYRLEKATREFYVYDFHVKKIFEELSRSYQLSDYFKLDDILTASPFRGLISELFSPNDFYLSQKDIAVATSICMRGYCDNQKQKNDNIIDFSYAFLKKLRVRIIEDQQLQERFSRIKKDAQEIVTDFDRSEIEETLANKKKLFTHYFRSFEDSNFDYQITVWHQAPDQSWIDCRSENSITIRIDPSSIREGFFLIGFDYESKGESLFYATRIARREYFNGTKSGFEDIDEAIWLK
ncbi:MAG: hypothetical protein AAFZ17_08610 [Cyanobacteria bacterium J06650_10]